MGVIKCHKHGRQRFLETCEHIATAVKNGAFPATNTVPLLNLKLCDRCFEKANLKGYKPSNAKEFLDLPIEAAQLLEAKLEKIYAETHRHAICLKCIEDVRLQQSSQ